MLYQYPGITSNLHLLHLSWPPATCFASYLLFTVFYAAGFDIQWYVASFVVGTYVHYDATLVVTYNKNSISRWLPSFLSGRGESRDVATYALCLLQVNIVITISLVIITCWSTSAQTTTSKPTVFQPLKQSDLLRAKALLRWLVNNRTENGTHTFNAGFIRLAFHDCVGGCDGCLNLRNPSNAGMSLFRVFCVYYLLQFHECLQC